MRFNKRIWSVAVAVAVGSVASVQAAVVPFTEDFSADNANWKDPASADLSFVAAGGPDASGFVTTAFSFAGAAEGDTPVLLRGQGNFDASGDAFVGDWTSEGVTTFSAWVRHDAPFPLTYFARFASPINFPGAVAINFAPVLPNTWTKISFDISALNPQFVTFEGADFNSVFGNVGNVQLGVSVSAALAGYTPAVTLGLDQPTITPEPATFGLMALGAWALPRRRGAK